MWQAFDLQHHLERQYICIYGKAIVDKVCVEIHNGNKWASILSELVNLKSLF